MKGRIIGYLLLMAGLCIIIYSLYIRYTVIQAQKVMLREFERVLEGISEGENYLAKNADDAEDIRDVVDTEDTEDAEATEDTQDLQPEERETDGPDEIININGQNILGIMEIPKIDLLVAVAVGTDTRTLKRAVGYFEGTALPGQKGNFCVAGHRSYTYNEFFNRLDELETGDEIIIRTKEGRFTYVVYDKFIIEPSEVWVLNPTPDPIITLITCTPIRVATHRLIVRGRLVQDYQRDDN